MKRTLSIFALAAVSATSAFAVEITPYVSAGIVADKAGTTAKRIGMADTINLSWADIDLTDPTTIPAAMEKALPAAFVPNAGGDMKFDAAIAGDFAVGLKIGKVRAEFEYALRSASEDSYSIFNGNLMEKVTIDGRPITMIPAYANSNVPASIATTTEVQHNSYMFNMYYDFEIADSNWMPYIGLGAGMGTYKQRATMNIDVKLAEAMPGTPDIHRSILALDNNKKEFEWQVALGAAYNFTEDWALDMAYRFNSSTVDTEFVYAHELKVAVRYSF